MRYLKLNYQINNFNKIKSQNQKNKPNYNDRQDQIAISSPFYHPQDRFRYPFNNSQSTRNISYQQRCDNDDSKLVDEENRRNQEQQQINENIKKKYEEIQKQEERKFYNRLEQIDKEYHRNLKEEEWETNLKQQSDDRLNKMIDQCIVNVKQIQEEKFKPKQEIQNKDSTKTFPYFPLDTRKLQPMQTPEKVIKPNQEVKSWDDKSSLSADDILLRGLQISVVIYECIEIVKNKIKNKQVKVPVMIKLG